jgi:hypothetical protein
MWRSNYLTMGITDGGYYRNESCSLSYIFTYLWGRRTRGRIAVGFTTTYAISFNISQKPKSSPLSYFPQKTSLNLATN